MDYSLFTYLLNIVGKRVKYTCIPPFRRQTATEAEIRHIPQRCFDFRAITEKLLSQNRQRHQKLGGNGITLLKPESDTNYRVKSEHNNSVKGTDDIEYVTTKFDSLATAPLLSDWKITGFTPTKVSRNKVYQNVRQANTDQTVGH